MLFRSEPQLPVEEDREGAIALFLAGGDPTFPIFLYGQLRFAQRLPVLIAMAVLLMVATVSLTLIAFRVGRRRA